MPVINARRLVTNVARLIREDILPKIASELKMNLRNPPNIVVERQPGRDSIVFTCFFSPEEISLGRKALSVKIEISSMIFSQGLPEVIRFIASEKDRLVRELKLRLDREMITRHPYQIVSATEVVAKMEARELARRGILPASALTVSEIERENRAHLKLMAEHAKPKRYQYVLEKKKAKVRKAPKKKGFCLADCEIKKEKK